MESAFTHLKKMYENELYDGVIPLASVIEDAFERDRTSLKPEQFFLVQMYYANSLFQLKQYRSALIVFRNGLQERKGLIKAKNSSGQQTNADMPWEMFTDAEICYKMALCLEQTKQIQEAINTLDWLPQRLHTIKMNMLEAKLLQQTGRHISALIYYKAVLRECPFHMEAIRNALIAGASESDVEAIISIGSKPMLPKPCVEWLTEVMESFTLMLRCQFREAANKLIVLEERGIFGFSNILEILIGEYFYYNGDYDRALDYLSRSYITNPNMIDGLMILATLYALKGDKDKLEQLTLSPMSVTEYFTEHWFVWALLFFAQGKYEKASYFAHKASFLNPRNVEATLLKAKVFLELKKYREANVQYKMLLDIVPYRFEIYEGLVTSSINNENHREGVYYTQEALRTLGKSPRVMVLLSRPLLVESATSYQAKACLEKALEMDKTYMPAVLELNDLLQEEENFEDSINLLKRTVKLKPSAELFALLGDAYVCNNLFQLAADAYIKAISMDHNNQRAFCGLVSLESSNKVNESGTFEPPMPNANPNEFQDNNFEMIEVQELIPPHGEMEGEGDTVWDNIELGGNHF